MSIRSIVTTGVGLRNNQRDIPTPAPPVYNSFYGAWTRPSDWPALPTLTSTSQEFAGLIAITNDTGNWVALTCTTSSGTYSVNWGDGTTSTGIASGTAAQHQYNYSTYSGSVLTEGYKAAVVTATPDTGNLTGINLQVKYVIGAPYPAIPNAYSTKWLDISVGSPYLTSLIFFNNTNIFLDWLQQIQIYSVASSYTTIGASLFYGLPVLQNVPTLNFPSNYNTINSIFYGCQSLRTVPIFPASSVAVDGTSAFQNCQSIDYISDSVFANITFSSLISMFNNCNSLKKAPYLKIGSSVVNASYMFESCSSLISVPNIITGNIANTSYMFDNCYNLASIPQFNTINVASSFSMFSNCYSLNTIPALNLSNSTSISYMFTNCSNLRSVPSLNLSAATDTIDLFNNCTSLTSVGTFTTTANLSNTYLTFNNCYALKSVPLFFTNSVSNAFGMFSNCRSLTNVPNINLSNVNSMSNMFLGCNYLQTIPTFNTINVTAMNNTFANCFSLSVCPAINTSNVTSMGNMFSYNYSLTDVQFTNTTNVSNMQGMFYNCSILNGANTTGMSSWNTSNVTNMGAMFSGTAISTTIPTFNTSNVTNVNTMFQNCQNLNSIPALNLNKVIVAGNTTNFIPSSGSIANFAPSNINVAYTLSNQLLSNTALQLVFTNLTAGNTTSRTITISSNPGADTPVALTGNTTANSNVIVMTSTTGYATGMLVTSANNISNAVPASFTASTSLVTLTSLNTGPANNTIVSFPSIVFTTGINAYTPYYVVNASANTFQVSTTSGGSALTLTNNGTGTVYIPPYITAVNTNANIVVSRLANATNTGQTITARYLDTSQALMKNWTVTG